MEKCASSFLIKTPDHVLIYDNYYHPVSKELFTFINIFTVKCTKGTLFLNPLFPSPKCTTKNVDFIVKNFFLRKHSSKFPLPFW